MGNITGKSDAGVYTYGARPHAVTQVAGTLNATYAYDANGNLLSGAGRTVSYYSWNMASQITGNGATLNLVYDADHTRIKETGPNGTTIYLNPRLDSGAHYEKVIGSNGVTEYKQYIYAGGEAVGVYTTRSNGVNDTKYFHSDHLGSIAVVTNDSGAVVARYSYDPFGNRSTAAGDPKATEHGFTGHETLTEVGLVNMNGRVFDPVLGRFMSADPNIQAPNNLQSYNRYSYVFNNPLSYTDPSGYLSLFGHKILPGLFNNNNARIAVAIAAIVYAPEISFWSASQGAVYLGSAAVGQGIAGGALIGYVSTGTLQGTVTGGVSGAAFGFVGDLGLTYPESVAAHAIAGGTMSVLQGGSFGSGAMAAGFAEFATPAYSGLGDIGEGVARAVVGGTASVLGGGKFANGAMTAAYGYLFNKMGHPKDFPHTWDPLVDKHVATYNAEGGLGQRDAEYLDPALIKSMIMVESGNNLAAYNSDPMQVNVAGDWVPEKANYGLTRGVAPGPDLGIQAGIEWLSYKAYTYDSAGNAVTFRGWPSAVARYNGGGDPDYVSKVFNFYNITRCRKCGGN